MANGVPVPANRSAGLAISAGQSALQQAPGQQEAAKRAPRKDSLVRRWVNQIDNGVSVLRELPAVAWAWYLACSLPFLVLFYDFVQEANFSAYYGENAGWRSFLVSLAWLGKCVGDLIFCGYLRATQSREAFSPRQIAWRWALPITFFLQPLSLLVVPWSFLVLLPYPSAVSFFRLLVPSLISHPEIAIRRSFSLATQDILAISGSLTLLFLGGFYLWLNLLVLWILVPIGLEGLLGVDTGYHTNGLGAFLNTTSIAITLFLSWALLDPVLHAIYARNSFTDEGKRTGIDLLGALRRYLPVLVAALCLSFANCLLPQPAFAQADPQTAQADPQTGQAPSPGVSIPGRLALRDAMQETMRDPEFAFRLPREAGQENWLLRGLRSLGKTISDIFSWLDRLARAGQTEGPVDLSKSGGILGIEVNLWMKILGVALLLGVVWLIVRNLRARKPKPVVLSAGNAIVVPDLTKEDVRADALPEDQWLQLAEDLAAKGDFRLAMRAVHLAGIRHFGERGLVSIASSKSGGDYRRELERRAKDQPPVIAGFRGSLREFEAIWYGFETASPDRYQGLRSQWQEIRAHGN